MEREPSRSLPGGGGAAKGAFTTKKTHEDSNSPLYAIYGVPVASSSQKAVVFCDDGSEATFITRSAAKRLGARKLRPTRIEMATLTSSEKLDTDLFEIILMTRSGRRCPVTAIALPEITGQVSQLDVDVLSELFTNFDCASLQRPKGNVDILLGADYFGLHPKKELASDGNLSIMEGELGTCVQGRHPGVKGETGYTVFSVCMIESSFVSSLCEPSHPSSQETMP